MIGLVYYSFHETFSEADPFRGMFAADVVRHRGPDGWRDGGGYAANVARRGTRGTAAKARYSRIRSLHSQARTTSCPAERQADK
jgi:hypothetical protein